MPISFLNPALLAGLAATAIPLILHLLFNREPRRVVFPDLSLLQVVKARQARSVGIQRWLLLLIRMLIIALIVLGAARPRVGGVAVGDGDRMSLVMILDSSASMQTVDEEGQSRFRRMLDEAGAVAAGLTEGSEVQWILAGGHAETVFGNWLPASVVAARDVGGLKPGDGTCDLSGALRLVAEQGEHAIHPLSAILFTDRQTPSTPNDEVAAAVAQLEAAGLQSFTVRNIGTDRRDGAILDVILPVHAVMADESVVIEAEVRSSIVDQIFHLELDGFIVAEAATTGGSGEVSRVRFALRAPAAGRHVGRVMTVGDRLAVDDQRPFVFDVHDRVHVLLVHGTGRGAWRFLAHALMPGFDAQTEDFDPVDLQVVDPDAWETGDLERTDVLILADPDPLGREKTQGVRSWLESGGQVWLMIGDPARRAELSEHLLPALADVDSLEFRVRSSAGAERLRLVTEEHPVFAGLPVSSLQTLEETSWRRNWRLIAPEAQLLAVLEGGDPVFLVFQQGQGRVVLMTSGLDAAATDLATNAMFPPLVQRLVSWLAGNDGQSGVYEADRPLRVALAADGRGDFLGDLSFEFRPPTAESGNAKVMEADIEWRGRRLWAVGPSRPEAGFWTLKVDGEALSRVVVVVPDGETRAANLEPDRYVERLEAAGLTVDATLTSAAPEDIGRLLAGRSLAAWCFLAAMLLLLLENRLARGRGEAGDGARGT